MNIKYVTSLELGKQLKEAGVKQESEWYWVELSHELVGRDQIVIANDLEIERYELQDIGVKIFYSAFHVGELGEMLPDMLSLEDKKIKNTDTGTVYLTCQKVGLWEVGYTTARNQMVFESVEDKNEAEARGKMVLYLKKEGLI